MKQLPKDMSEIDTSKASKEDSKESADSKHAAAGTGEEEKKEKKKRKKDQTEAPVEEEAQAEQAQDMLTVDSEEIGKLTTKKLWV